MSAEKAEDPERQTPVEGELVDTAEQERAVAKRAPGAGSVVKRALVGAVTWYPRCIIRGVQGVLDRTPVLTQPKIDSEAMEQGGLPMIVETVRWSWNDFTFHAEPTGHGWRAFFGVCLAVGARTVLPICVLALMVFAFSWTMDIASVAFKNALVAAAWLLGAVVLLILSYLLIKVLPKLLKLLGI